MELAKQDVSEEGEHWTRQESSRCRRHTTVCSCRLWHDHPATMQQSAKAAHAISQYDAPDVTGSQTFEEKMELKQMARAACREDAKEACPHNGPTC